MNVYAHALSEMQEEAVEGVAGWKEKEEQKREKKEEC